MKSVLVTGASSGFGFNVALEMASLGWRVFGTSRSVERGAALLEEADRRRIEGLSIIDLDVTSIPSIEAGISRVLSETDGQLDALLNNAGYYIFGAFEDLSDGDCRAQMDTNFFGVLNVTRAALPIMRKQQRGRIVIVTSNSVNLPNPMLTTYAASKWALEGWAEGLALELAPFNIDVAVIQPGGHRTKLTQNGVAVMPEGTAYGEWFARAAEGLQSVSSWSRDTELATAPIVRALTDPSAPFRQAVGEDTEIFAMLKGLFPYEVRAWLEREIAGLPGRGEFVGEAPAEVSQVCKHVLGRLFKNPDAAVTALSTLLSRR